MDSTTATVVFAIVISLGQLGLGAGAWKLANRLAGKVENHENRLGVLERRPA